MRQADQHAGTTIAKNSEAEVTPEKRIEMLLCSWLRAHGFVFWKTDRQGTYDPVRKTFRANCNPYKIRGVSDILGVLRGGRILAIEVKAEKGRVSPEQKRFIDMINAAGGKAFVARSIEDLEKNLNPSQEGHKGEAH